jgi:hypothetical protein
VKDSLPVCKQHLKGRGQVAYWPQFRVVAKPQPGESVVGSQVEAAEAIAAEAKPSEATLLPNVETVEYVASDIQFLYAAVLGQLEALQLVVAEL